MDFVTLGMFIIDEIHYQPPRKPEIQVMGGAGLYAALGARLFRPPPSASGIGWIIHEGHDFPLHIKSTIDTWKTSCEFIQTPERETTRARNTYGSPGFRDFEYLNEKINLDENSLTLTQLTSKPTISYAQHTVVETSLTGSLPDVKPRPRPEQNLR